MKDQRIIAIDPATKDGDWTAEVEAEIVGGKIMIKDVRRYRDTIDGEAVDVTDQKRLTK